MPRQAMRMEVIADLRAMFDTTDHVAAQQFLQAAIQKYAVLAPKLSA
jgi:putative transposase